ncbi:MAG: hypothetical protein AAGE43_14670 [Pseudomonadota bacterium]
MHPLMKNRKNIQPQRSELPTSSLSPGGQLFVWSVRQWLRSSLEKRCVKRDLLAPHHNVGCTEAIVHLDEFMCALSIGAHRKIEVRPPECGLVSGDEIRLLELMRAGQRGDRDSARAIAAGLVAGHTVSPLVNIATDYGLQLEVAGIDLCGLRFLRMIDTANAAVAAS